MDTATTIWMHQMLWLVAGEEQETPLTIDDIITIIDESGREDLESENVLEVLNDNSLINWISSNEIYVKPFNVQDQLVAA